MKKWLLRLGLFLLALVVWLPLWLLLTGALMGKGELLHNLSPVLGEGKGFASWPLLPQFPTLRPLVELLLDTPKFFVMFWNSCAMVAPSCCCRCSSARPPPGRWRATAFGGGTRSTSSTSYSCSCPSR